MRLHAHHRMLIRLHLDRITDLDRRAAALEDEAAAALDAIPAARVTCDGEPAPGPATASAAERLAQIPGVTPELAIAIIAESGSPGRFPDRAPSEPCVPVIEAHGSSRPQVSRVGRGICAAG